MADEPPKKKRKLPPLDDSFASSGPLPEDSSAKHQGRIREIPHVKGQWACHAFIELVPSETLRKTLDDAFASVAQDRDKGIHSLLEAGTSLHVSLSRPLILQASQRDELRYGIASIAASFSGFQSRYAVFDTLENDPQTRRFLGIELGTGWTELKAVVSSLDKLLLKMRLPPYYETPRFHTSIAWSKQTVRSHADAAPFSVAELQQLETGFGQRLRKEELWVGELCLKIGKEVHRYRLMS